MANDDMQKMQMTNSQQITVTCKAGMRQLKRALRIVEKFNKAVEKANSLADELASQKIEVEIITQHVQRQRHKMDKRFSRS